jgi:SAM-dependent methyltransferase
MGLGQKLLGDPQGYAEDASGGLIRRARLYEFSAAVAFAGRRRRVYDRLVAQSGAAAGNRVLDIGCGTGYFARRIAPAVEPGRTVVGIDPFPAGHRLRHPRRSAELHLSCRGGPAAPAARCIV